MSKTFSKIEISVIKSAAKNAVPYVVKNQKIEAEIKEIEARVEEQIRKRVTEKIEKKKAEINGNLAIIDALNTSVKKITGGYTSDQLIDIKKEATGSMDPKTGKEIFKTVYALKYPETVVPPTTEGVAGSDYDKDKEEAECPVHDGSDDPTDWEGEEEMPEELMQQQVEAASEASEADPFAGNEGDPFNQ